MKAFLGVLLGVSLLANVLLAVRLSRAPEPAPVASKAAGTEKRTEADAATLRDSLDAERKKVEELKAKVERLETDKKVLVQEAPAPGKEEKLAAFKAKLRKLFKISKDQEKGAGNLDPDEMMEVTGVMMELMKVSASRGKDPKTYADYLQAFYEVGLEDQGAKLSESQSAAFHKLFQDLAEEFAKIPVTPAGDKLLREIEIEGTAMSRIQALLSEQQRSVFAKGEWNAVATGNMLSTTYVMKNQALDTISKSWSAAYQLDAAQMPQVKAAAQAYLDAMNRYEAENKGKALTFQNLGSADHYQYRLRSVREQLAALQVLQASMTPAQQERVRTQAMREILLIDPASLGDSADVITAPAEK